FLGGLSGSGTVFKLNKDGSGYSVLRSFGTTSSDARNPMAGVIEGSDGILYGTTAYGGSLGFGTIFKLNKDGSGYSILRNINGVSGQGAYPNAALLQGSDGVLYGTSPEGGIGLWHYGGGSVFKINRDGTGYAVVR